jgi:hypothetical protein
MSDFATICRFVHIGEAEAFRLALEHAGIAAYLEGANLVVTNSLLSNAIGGIKLQVADADVVEAKKILEETGRRIAADRPKPTGAAITFRCSECGETINFPSELAGNCEVCPQCHEYVDVPEATV